MKKKIIKPSKKTIDSYRKHYGLELKEIILSDDEEYENYLAYMQNHFNKKHEKE